MCNRFVHGGVIDNVDVLNPQSSIQASNSDQMYILSLPSFRWFLGANTSIDSRSFHTCHATNSSQMIMIGGTDPTYLKKKDPWPQGIGVFDMTALKFKDSYEAKAGPYKTPDVVKRYYNTE